MERRTRQVKIIDPLTLAVLTPAYYRRDELHGATT